MTNEPDRPTARASIARRRADAVARSATTSTPAWAGSLAIAGTSVGAPMGGGRTSRTRTAPGSSWRVDDRHGPGRIGRRSRTRSMPTAIRSRAVAATRRDVQHDERRVRRRGRRRRRLLRRCSSPAAASRSRSARSAVGWPAPHELDGRRGRAPGRDRRPGAVAVDRARLRIDGRRALRVVRADGPHRPADRARQRADVRPGPRARARPRRPPGQRGLARDVRRRRLPGDQPRARPRGRRRRPAPRRLGPRRVGPAGRHGRPVSVATSSSWSRRAPPARLVAQRVLDGIAALPAVAGQPITVSAGVARFPADGTTADDLIAARRWRARRAPGAGRAARREIAATSKAG